MRSPCLLFCLLTTVASVRPVWKTPPQISSRGAPVPLRSQRASESSYNNPSVAKPGPPSYYTLPENFKIPDYRPAKPVAPVSRPFYPQPGPFYPNQRNSWNNFQSNKFQRYPANPVQPPPFYGPRGTPVALFIPNNYEFNRGPQGPPTTSAQGYDTSNRESERNPSENAYEQNQPQSNGNYGAALPKETQTTQEYNAGPTSESSRTDEPMSPSATPIEDTYTESYKNPSSVGENYGARNSETPAQEQVPSAAPTSEEPHSAETELQTSGYKSDSTSNQAYEGTPAPATPLVGANVYAPEVPTSASYNPAASQNPEVKTETPGYNAQPQAAKAYGTTTSSYGPEGLKPSGPSTQTSGDQYEKEITPVETPTNYNAASVPSPVPVPNIPSAYEETKSILQQYGSDVEEETTTAGPSPPAHVPQSVHELEGRPKTPEYNQESEYKPAKSPTTDFNQDTNYNPAPNSKEESAPQVVPTVNKQTSGIEQYGPQAPPLARPETASHRGPIANNYGIPSPVKTQSPTPGSEYTSAPAPTPIPAKEEAYQTAQTPEYQAPTQTSPSSPPAAPSRPSYGLPGGPVPSYTTESTIVPPYEKPEEKNVELVPRPITPTLQQTSRPEYGPVPPQTETPYQPSGAAPSPAPYFPRPVNEQPYQPGPGAATPVPESRIQQVHIATPKPCQGLLCHVNTDRVSLYTPEKGRGPTLVISTAARGEAERNGYRPANPPPRIPTKNQYQEKVYPTLRPTVPSAEETPFTGSPYGAQVPSCPRAPQPAHGPTRFPAPSPAQRPAYTPLPPRENPPAPYPPNVPFPPSRQGNPNPYGASEQPTLPPNVPTRFTVAPPEAYSPPSSNPYERQEDNSPPSLVIKPVAPQRTFQVRPSMPPGAPAPQAPQGPLVANTPQTPNQYPAQPVPPSQYQEATQRPFTPTVVYENTRPTEYQVVQSTIPPYSPQAPIENPEHPKIVPNRVRGNAQVVCKDNGIEFTINTLFPFKGQIFASDRKKVPGCVHQLEGSKTTTVFLPNEECGIRNVGGRPEETAYHMQVVVMFEQEDGTTTMQEFMAQCVNQRVLYKKQKLPKRIEEALEELHLVPTRLEQKAPVPVVEMKVVVDNHHDIGPEVNTAELGMNLAIQWNLVPESDAYGFHVKDCIVRDTINDMQHKVIDSTGCSTDMNIMTHPHYDTYHDTAISRMMAFKVPDHTQVTIRCDVLICTDVPDTKTNLSSCAMIPTPPFCADLITSPSNSIVFDAQGGYVEGNRKRRRNVEQISDDFEEMDVITGSRTMDVRAAICIGDNCNGRPHDRFPFCVDPLLAATSTAFSTAIFVISLTMHVVVKARRR